MLQGGISGISGISGGGTARRRQAQEPQAQLPSSTHSPDAALACPVDLRQRAGRREQGEDTGPAGTRPAGARQWRRGTRAGGQQQQRRSCPATSTQPHRFELPHAHNANCGSPVASPASGLLRQAQPQHPGVWGALTTHCMPCNCHSISPALPGARKAADHPCAPTSAPSLACSDHSYQLIHLRNHIAGLAGGRHRAAAVSHTARASPTVAWGPVAH